MLIRVSWYVYKTFFYGLHMNNSQRGQAFIKARPLEMEAKRLSHTLTYVLDLSKAIHAQLGSRARCSWVRFFLGINVNTLLFQVLTPLFWHSVPDQVHSTYVLGVLCTWSIQRLNATLFFVGMGLTSFPRCLIFPPSRSEIFSFAPGGRENKFSWERGWAQAPVLGPSHSNSYCKILFKKEHT